MGQRRRILRLLRRAAGGGVLGCWILAAPLSGAQEIIIHLRNGDRITGRLVIEDAQRVVLTNAVIGRVTIPAEGIKAREPVPIPPATPQATPEQTAAAGAEGEAKSIEAAPKPPPVKPKPKPWRLDVQMGVNLQYNQRESELYYGTLKFDYLLPRLRNTLDYKANYGRTEGLLSANNMRGSLRTEFDVSEDRRTFLFNEGGAGYDEIRKIDFTYDESFGVGYKLLTLTNIVLSVDTGANYQEQHFSDGSTQNDFALRLGEKLSWKLSSRVSLDQAFEFYPRSPRLDDYRVRFESTFRYLLNSHLSLNLTVLDIYDTSPAPGVTPNDLQIRSTIGVRF